MFHFHFVRLRGFPTLHPTLSFGGFLSGQSPSLGLCPLLLHDCTGRCLADVSPSADTPPRCVWRPHDGSFPLL